MIYKNNENIGFIYKNNENIDKIYKNNELIFEQGFTREQTGVPPITTTYQAIGKNLKDYRIYGNSVQDGTPTPETPIEIESVGDKTKNLIDIYNYTYINKKVAIDVSNLIEGNTYTFSSKYPVSWIKISDANNGYSSVQKNNWSGFSTFTFTMQRNANIPQDANQYLFISSEVTGSYVPFIEDINDIKDYEIQIEDRNNKDRL